MVQSRKRDARNKIRIPSKKMQAIKAQRRALKAQKNAFAHEKMTLEEAIAVLRVSSSNTSDTPLYNFTLLKAVEVAKPEAAYELVIKCKLERGMAVPRGRINLPRDAGAKRAETILVFAEGRAAQEAKNAGADIVGGLELVDGVRLLIYSSTEYSFVTCPDHQQSIPSQYNPLCPLPASWYCSEARSCPRAKRLNAIRKAGHSYR